MTRNTKSKATKPTTSPCTSEVRSRVSADAPFFTIGHSTRPRDDFVALLREAEVRVIADVRTIPRSRTNPQYNADALEPALAAYQIGYEHIAALGGLRGRQRDVPQTLNAFW